MLGLFHNNMFNFFNFGCDIMEPFRPIVDRTVKNINPQKFEVEEKRLVLSLLSMELYIDGKNQTLLNTIKIYAKSVFEAIESGDTAQIKFYRYEL
jgi:CRISPR/Cas system-associated endonuclease Cas1